MPHISVRRLASQEILEEFLGALQSDGVVRNVFVVGGDPSTPEGPYSDSLQVIRTGLLQQFGCEHVSISGYPEGHPDISSTLLWEAIESKSAALDVAGLPGTIITQFGFDVDAVITWIEAVRGRGIELPIRIGVPGPAGIKRLISYASRFGVASSAGIAKKYGFSLTNLVGTAGPDRFIRELDRRLESSHGEIKLHFYTFGGLRATQEWITSFERERT
ncbi:methylenetetrahydrofolate reductase [Leifsonia sp. Root112D2]|uniref:methylenetetrahydrofolate reductase n=1 Tax=Leifsonia sp. Root112D2 TaxID=1736426 RepID=UPI000A68C03C